MFLILSEKNCSKLDDILKVVKLNFGSKSGALLRFHTARYLSPENVKKIWGGPGYSPYQLDNGEHGGWRIFLSYFKKEFTFRVRWFLERSVYLAEALQVLSLRINSASSLLSVTRKTQSQSSMMFPGDTVAENQFKC